MKLSQRTKEKAPLTPAVYEASTPLWDKYYRETRKQVRFPRYYKKALNW